MNRERTVPHWSVIDKLLGSTTRADFLKRHWDRAPLLIRGKGRGFPQLLTLEDFDHLMTSTGLRDPTFRLARSSEAVQSETYAIPSMSWGPGTVSGFARPERLFDLVRSGFSLVLEEPDRVWPPIARLREALETAFTGNSFCHVFYTPGGTQAFNPHYDVQGAFVLQCVGSKRWRVYEPVLDKPLRTQPCAAAGCETGELVLDTVLQAGDALFVPRGFVHLVETLDESSLHITAGVVPYTWADVLQHGLDTATDARLREPLRFDSQAAVALTDEQDEGLEDGIEDALKSMDLGKAFASMAGVWSRGRRPVGPGALIDAATGGEA